MKRVFTQTFGVVGAIIERNRKILLVKEAAKEQDAGKWNHPAGWIEIGENPIEGVKREVKEEAGLEFSPTHILGIYSLVRKDLNPIRHPIKIIFIGNISGQETDELADDVTEKKWFAPEKIEKMDLNTLRDLDIKQMVKDYFEGKRYPLELITHTSSHSPSQFNMRQETCNLCAQQDVKSGKDKLLYEDSFCYIIDNGNTRLNINGKIMFAKKRISLIIKKHKKYLTKKERDSVDSILTNFIKKKFGLRKDKDYFLKTTMNTYPNHYHTHAYILPFAKKGKIK